MTSWKRRWLESPVSSSVTAWLHQLVQGEDEHEEERQAGAKAHVRSRSMAAGRV
jgi:hypothetical protein